MGLARPRRRTSAGVGGMDDTRAAAEGRAEGGVLSMHRKTRHHAKSQVNPCRALPDASAISLLSCWMRISLACQYCVQNNIGVCLCMALVFYSITCSIQFSPTCCIFQFSPRAVSIIRKLAPGPRPWLFRC